VTGVVPCDPVIRGPDAAPVWPRGTSLEGTPGPAASQGGRSPAQLAANPRWPLLTVGAIRPNRCYGHAKGMVGEDERGSAWWRWRPACVMGEASPRRPPASLASRQQVARQAYLMRPRPACRQTTSQPSSTSRSVSTLGTLPHISRQIYHFLNPFVFVRDSLCVLDCLINS
jgi:hypothetical protein